MTDKVFAPYIQRIYKERQEIKRTEPVRAEFLKLMMNSLYGKFGSGEHSVRFVTRNTEQVTCMTSHST